MSKIKNFNDTIKGKRDPKEITFRQPGLEKLAEMGYNVTNPAQV